MIVAVALALLAAPATFTTLSRQATAAREANRVDEAAALYRKALALKPAWPEGWWYLGTLHYEADRHTACRDAFRKFVALDAKAAPGWALLGLCEYRTKEYGPALAHLLKARALGLSSEDPVSAAARFHTALLHTKNENYEGALQILFSFARNSNANPAVVEATGIAALRRPIVPEELPPADRSLAIKLGRAVVSGVERRPAETKQFFDEVIAEYPKTANLHYSYASFLLIAEPDLGVQEYLKELKLDPAHLPSLVSVAFEYLKRGEPKNALPFAERAVKAAPRNFTTHAALGRALVDSGEIERGVKELEISIQLEPTSPQTRIALASAYQKLGRKEDAAKQRAEFLRLKKELEVERKP